MVFGICIYQNIFLVMSLFVIYSDFFIIHRSPSLLSQATEEDQTHHKKGQYISFYLFVCLFCFVFLLGIGPSLLTSFVKLVKVG